MPLVTKQLELTKEEVFQFRSDGYTTVRGLVGRAELAAIRTKLNELQDNNNLAVDNFSDSLIVFRNLWRQSDELKEIAWNLAPLAGHLMMEEHVRLFADLALIKPPATNGGRPTEWHQDSPNFPFDRRGFLTIWIAVEDVPRERGALTFLPRSHRLGSLGALDGHSATEKPVSALLKEDDLAIVGDAVTVPLQAGDATVHDGHLLHYAGANTGERSRRAWAVRFIPGDTLYTGAAHNSTDNIGMRPFEPFDHEHFPSISTPRFSS